MTANDVLNSGDRGGDRQRRTLPTSATMIVAGALYNSDNDDRIRQQRSRTPTTHSKIDGGSGARRVINISTWPFSSGMEKRKMSINIKSGKHERCPPHLSAIFPLRSSPSPSPSFIYSKSSRACPLLGLLSTLQYQIIERKIDQVIKKFYSD